MIENLLISIVTMMVCVMIQCVVVAILLRMLFWLDRRDLLKPTIPRSSCILMVVLLIMLAGNIVQIGVWAGIFWFQGGFEDYATSFYHSAVNFTTLGYGDLVLGPDHRLLGALEAANGVLMFGLTTSIVFAVLHGLMRRGWAQRAEKYSNLEGSFDI